jgi:regulatory protein
MARKSKDSPAEARAYALKLLSYRARSIREMTGKLRIKGFHEDHINSTTEYLLKIGLMNDESVASDLYRLTTEYKSLGKNGIRTFLMKRGINKNLIDKTLADHSSEIDEKTAMEFAVKRMEVLKKYPRDVIKRRLWGLLQRRGFSYDVIKRVVDSLL